MSYDLFGIEGAALVVHSVPEGKNTFYPLAKAEAQAKGQVVVIAKQLWRACHLRAAKRQ